MNKSTPFLKWAGGKRWLTESHIEIFPKKFNRYYEPFLGSGAVFFSIQPEHSTLSDLNVELIETYDTIKNDWEKVLARLELHHKKHSKEYYYQIRNTNPRTPHTRAARFIYLNRTCWNGLYRVNLKGEFNVPIGTKQNAILPTDDFESLSKNLQNSTLISGDFETTIDLAADGDLLFVDPPYTVKHNLNGFIKYNEKIFSWDDQIRLSECLKRAAKRGCKIVATNAYHPAVKELYEEAFNTYALDRHSVIAASSTFRGRYEELLITTTAIENSDYITGSMCNSEVQSIDTLSRSPEIWGCEGKR
ncbi:TPA: DNA adenine methylase [Pseudomonas aeruginosa]|nr:Dam family site-specific DNA-(adenine-N6)-methyltransferase [Pseudomonas aeruginosa]MDP5648353.1 Dam family site-specific DNA-(adenine-N6)-methyltransferase [Pseudomonas aeruginosa]HEJ1761823.1 Dam family site-specific DNA-(adenine-N6)-methyltransferase [Pseudomonas aeruginosa]